MAFGIGPPLSVRVGGMGGGVPRREEGHPTRAAPVGSLGAGAAAVKTHDVALRLEPPAEAVVALRRPAAIAAAGHADVGPVTDRSAEDPALGFEGRAALAAT